MAKATSTKEQTPDNNECFVIMPISDHADYTSGHFLRVYEDLFRPACIAAGYKPVRGDDIKRTNLIHLDILRRLLNSPMAICDLSSRNPNVLFELGLRQAFDKPTVLVQDENTPDIFDINPLRHTKYNKELKYRDVLSDQEKIKQALLDTKEAVEKGDDIFSIVRLLALTNPASFKDASTDSTAQLLKIIMSEISSIKSDLNSNNRSANSGRYISSSPQKDSFKGYLEQELSHYCKINKYKPLEVSTDSVIRQEFLTAIVKSDTFKAFNSKIKDLIMQEFGPFMSDISG